MYPFLNTDSPTSGASGEKKDTVFVTLWNPTRYLRSGHVVAFYSPLRPDLLAVKRVVGLEGDVVEVRKGASFYDDGIGGGAITGQCKRRRRKMADELGDAHTAAPAYAAETVEVVVVPPGHVWVEGEHPEGSRWSVDSNTYGPIPMGLLIGKVEAVVWPWTRRGWIRWQDWRGCERVRVGGGRRVEVEVFGLE